LPNCVDIVNTQHAGQLFVVFKKVTPLAAVYSTATMCGVSILWWNPQCTCVNFMPSLIYRQHNKQVMKRYFQQVFSPFKCNPQRLQSIQVEGSVYGSTEFNSKLYIVCRGSSAQSQYLLVDHLSLSVDLMTSNDQSTRSDCAM
jgi:hypothetical protein